MWDFGCKSRYCRFNCKKAKKRIRKIGISILITAKTISESIHTKYKNYRCIMFIFGEKIYATFLWVFTYVASVTCVTGWLEHFQWKTGIWLFQQNRRKIMMEGKKHLKSTQNGLINYTIFCILFSEIWKLEFFFRNNQKWSSKYQFPEKLHFGLGATYVHLVQWIVSTF